MEDQGVALIMSTRIGQYIAGAADALHGALIKSLRGILAETEQTFLFNGSLGSDGAVDPEPRAVRNRIAPVERARAAP